jgi:hypothetical protein
MPPQGDVETRIRVGWVVVVMKEEKENRKERKKRCGH